MNHFDKIAAALEDSGLDAMLLTGEANRFYASGFHSTGIIQRRYLRRGLRTLLSPR